MCEVSIRGEGTDHLTIALIDRAHMGASDYWDGNWISATVNLVAGGLCGTISCFLRAEELGFFFDQLTNLQQTLHGTAEFTTMEQQLYIQLTGNGRGHMTVRCVIQDQPGVGNRLDCTLNTDQSFTRETLRQLAVAVRVYPVIGEP
jgi:hypothetical protein